MVHLDIWFIVVLCVVSFVFGMLFDMSLRTKTTSQIIAEILQDHQPIEV